MNSRLYICKCGSIQHQFVISVDDDYAYVSIHLAPLPLLQRIKHAIKYVLGFRCRYGDFEEILFDPVEAISLGDFLLTWAQGDDPGFKSNDVH